LLCYCSIILRDYYSSISIKIYIELHFSSGQEIAKLALWRVKSDLD
jgi:hypothetical protein